MPAKIDLTVPKGFRRGAPVPIVLRLHCANVPSSDGEAINGVPVTKALRTLLDLWDEGKTRKPLLMSAFQKGLRRGLITRTEVRRAAADSSSKATMRALEKGSAR